MEEPSGFQDWELLYNSDTGLDVSSPDSSDALKGFGGVEGATDGGIKSDYFALDSEKGCALTLASDEGEFPDPGNSGLVDPVSESGCLGPPKGEPGFDEVVGFARDNSGGILTSDQEGELGSREALKSEAGLEGIEVGIGNFGVILSDADGNSTEDEREEVGLGEMEDTVGVEAEGEDPSGSSDSPKRRDELEISEERSAGDANLGNLSAGEGDKTQMIWWKLPWELLKFYAFKVKPVWSISVAAALIGVVMLWRRLYKMKPKTRKLPLKISLEDKKVSQFMIQAARLNEAFQVVRRVPIIRPLPANGSTSWPVVASR